MKPYVSGFCTATIVEILLLGSAAAQDASASWINGQWKGTQGNNWSHPTTFDFLVAVEKTQWSMYRRSDRNADYWEAAGFITKITEDSVEMEGKYTGGTYANRWAHGVLRFWLTRTRDDLTGRAQGMDGTSWNVSLRRAK